MRFLAELFIKVYFPTLGLFLPSFLSLSPFLLPFPRQHNKESFPLPRLLLPLPPFLLFLRAKRRIEEIENKRQLLFLLFTLLPKNMTFSYQVSLIYYTVCILFIRVFFDAFDGDWLNSRHPWTWKQNRQKCSFTEKRALNRNFLIRFMVIPFVWRGARLSLSLNNSHLHTSFFREKDGTERPADAALSFFFSFLPHPLDKKKKE